MRRAFISIPVKNRTREEIEAQLKRMKEIAIFKLDDRVEFINTTILDRMPYDTKFEAVWYLGKSIQLLSQCDTLVCLKNIDNKYNGCIIEKEIAKRYGLYIVEVDLW